MGVPQKLRIPHPFQVGSVIQATGTVEFEDREPPKDSKWPPDCLHYTVPNNHSQPVTKFPMKMRSL